ncbi:hypothetical protein [Krasilnikovia sp. MM14-A1259]|uniref:hypothetical protein n=1 Tax=Krasilnikovia sp. MM14-A1259 TaxID=3373539 RepID=UPI00399D105D
MDFTTINTTTSARLADERRCSLCGQHLGYWANQAMVVAPNAPEWGTVAVATSDHCAHVETVCNDSLLTWAIDWLADPSSITPEVAAMLRTLGNPFK